MADGFLGGFNQQRGADINYLTQLDQMRRQQAQLDIERQRQAAQQGQFGQEMAFREREAEARRQLAQDQLAAQQSQAQEAMAMQADQVLSQSMRDLRNRTHVTAQDAALIGQQQRQAEARNALKVLLSGGGEASTADIGRAVLPYDTKTGIDLIKAGRDELRQQQLLERTGGTGIQPAQGYRWTKTGDLEAIPGGNADPAVMAQMEAIKSRAPSKEVEASKQKISEAKDVIGLLDMAQPYIEKGTGSYLGAGVNQLGQTIGLAGESAEANARLKAIEGLLISKMPKMSGPQSDKDVLLYRQMAGQLGDPTVPSNVKQAAMETIRQINENYIGSGRSQNTPTSQDLPKTFNAPPDPRQFEGKTITNPETGQRLMARGGQWVRVK